MKFTVNKADLLSKLTPAMGTVSNKNTITAIEGVLLETLDNGMIRISTYDMNKGFRAMIAPTSIDREGRFIINAQRLYQAIKVMPEGDITFDINDRLNCELTGDNASFSMFAMRGEDFPNLPELVTERGFNVSSEILRKMISKVSHSIAEQDNRPMLCGAFFKISHEAIEVVSCDSYTLSKCRTDCEVGFINGEDRELSFIIPGHALGELSKVLSDGGDEPIRFYLSRKHAIINKGDVIFFTRTIDSDYIDYNKIIPKDNHIIVKLNRDRLYSGLERANIIAEEKIAGSGRSFVKLNIDNGYFNLSSSSVNGTVTDEMRCTQVGEAIEIGFNCRFLLNSIKVIDSEELKITLKSSTAAITIEPDEREENFSQFYMILPLRMNEQK